MKGGGNLPRTEKPVIIDVSKLTISQCRKAYKELSDAYTKITENSFYCHHCGKFRPKTNFYKSSKTTSGVIPTCKRCIYIVATNYDEKTKSVNVTEESIKAALKLADLPFIENLYETGIAEVSNEASGKAKSNVWTSMIKNLQSLPQYYGMAWEDSDIFSITNNSIHSESQSNLIELSGEVKETYEKNKKLVLRTVGCDPFLLEKEEDKPLLYNKLANFIDDSVKDDGFKLEAVIEIVQLYKDIKHTNDDIAEYRQKIKDDPKAISTLKALISMKKEMAETSLKLAKDNGISENNNNRKSKGAGTLSGLLKQMGEMNLEAVEINTFTYETNQAIDAIMTANHQNQLRQLNPDENDWENEVIYQKKLLFQLQRERDNAVEMARCLRKENKDLKDFLIEKKLIDENLQVINHD